MYGILVIAIVFIIYKFLTRNCNNDQETNKNNIDTNNITSKPNTTGTNTQTTKIEPISQKTTRVNHIVEPSPLLIKNHIKPHSIDGWFQTSGVYVTNKTQDSCPYHGYKLVYVDQVEVREGIYKYRTTGPCCYECRRFFAEENWKKYAAKYQPGKRDVYFNNTGDNILYLVDKNIPYCKTLGHSIETVTAHLVTIKNREVTFDAYYCYDCGIYFLEKSIFEKWMSVYGFILGSYVDKTNGVTGNSNKKMHSILNMYGYNVQQGNGLTPEDRRAILAYVVDHGILYKDQVVSFLEYLINFNGKKRNMQIAISKWNSDVQWIMHYHKNAQRWVDITDVQDYSMHYQRMLQ